jgi:hypothetical protein
VLEATADGLVCPAGTFGIVQALPWEMTALGLNLRAVGGIRFQRSCFPCPRFFIASSSPQWSNVKLL